MSVTNQRSKMTISQRTVTGNEDRHDETVNLQMQRVSRRQQGKTYDEHTAMIPAITTGTEHFIIKSGRRTDMAEIPTPDFAVP